MHAKTIFGFKTLAFVGAMAPVMLLAQSHQEHGGHGAHGGGHGHAHMGQTVSCENLASPPWDGLPQQDRNQIADLRDELSSLVPLKLQRPQASFQRLVISRVWESIT